MSLELMLLEVHAEYKLFLSLHNSLITAALSPIFYPASASGRTNTALRGMLAHIDTQGPGLAAAGFTSKCQTAIAAKNTELRREVAREPNKKLVTRTVHSGRKETVVAVSEAGSTSRSRESTPARTGASTSRSREGTPGRTVQQTSSHSSGLSTSSAHKATAAPVKAPTNGKKSPTTPHRTVASGRKTPSKGSHIPVPKTKMTRKSWCI